VIKYLVLPAIGEEREMKSHGVSLSIHLTELAVHTSPKLLSSRLPYERSDILAGRHESQPQLHADH
jgi:hypothetical protein